MNLTLPSPEETIDLSTESERILIQRARISAQIAGYKSIRHFTIAALLGIVEKNPIEPATTKNSQAQQPVAA